MTDLRKLAEEGWNAYFAHDLDGCMATYADDAIVELPGMPPLQGKDAIRAAWEMFLTALPDDHPTFIRHLVDGETVVTEVTSEATHNGPLMMPTGDALPPSGRKVVTKSVVVQDVSGDKVVKQVFYFDNLEFMQQLGVIPAMEAAAAG